MDDCRAITMCFSFGFAFNFPVDGMCQCPWANRAQTTYLVSPQEKSSKCQNAYTGRIKFQTGNARR